MNEAVIVQAPLLGDIRWADRPFIEPLVNMSFERRIKKALGVVPGTVRYIAGVGWMEESTAAINLWHPAALTRGQEGVVRLVVAQDNSCRHCYGASRAMMRLMGYSEETVRRLETDIHTAPLAEREKAALDVCRRVSRGSPRVTRADLAGLQAAGWSRDEVVEFLVLTAFTLVGTRVSTLLAVQPEGVERLQGSLLGRLLRPVIGRMLRRRGAPWPLPPAPEPGSRALADVLASLEASTARPVVQAVMRMALAPSTLPARAKGLVFAIVGAGLECPACTDIGRGLLLENGFAAGEVDSLVTHLGSPKLDEFETRLARFARETIRYRAEAIQARCAEFYLGLGRETIVEIVGLCAMANGLGRLSALAAR